MEFDIKMDLEGKVSTVFCGLGEGLGVGCYEYGNEPWGDKQGEFID